MRRILMTAVIAAAVAGPAVPQAAPAGELDALVSKVAPSIASVRTVVKITMAGGPGDGQEGRFDMVMATVDPSGVLVGGYPRVNMPRGMRGGRGGGGGRAPAFEVTPTSFKVVFEREEKEHDAFLVARDTDLNLFFIQVEGLGDRKLRPVPFVAGPGPALGERVYQVGRLRKVNDYAPLLLHAEVTGRIEKPRHGIALQAQGLLLGLPVFTARGDAFGILTQFAADADDDGAPDGGAQGGGTFVVPAKSVASVVEAAKKRAIELIAERAKTPADKPATPPGPGDETPKKSGEY